MRCFAYSKHSGLSVPPPVALEFKEAVPATLPLGREGRETIMEGGERDR